MMTRRKLLSLLGLSSLLSNTLGASISTESTNPQVSLDHWLSQERHQVKTSADHVIQELLAAADNQQSLAFYYFGGSNPRQLRHATVQSVFRLNCSSITYISAYCHLRQELRTFRADRISLA